MLIAKVNSDEHTGDTYNMSLLKELLKDRESQYEVEKGSDNETKGIMPNEDDKTAGSPIHTGPGRE